MNIPVLHRWPRKPKAAIALQKKLACELGVRAFEREARLFGGIDVAFSPDGAQAIAGIVVWDSATGQTRERILVRAPVRFPYVPGLLSFREIPLVLRGLRKLKTTPEVFLCDGQGYAHPRRLGLASHLGLWLEQPTVGCAKSRLCGEHQEPAPQRGAFAPLLERGEQVGVVLRTRTGVKPLYISPGNRCDIAAAMRLTLAACTKYRLPEPTRLAHQLVTAARTR